MGRKAGQIVMVFCKAILASLALASLATVANAKTVATTHKDLSGSWVADEDLRQLATNKAIRSLDLSHTHLSDRALLYLRPASQLESLDFGFSEQLADEGLAYIKDWRKLRRINLHGTKVTDTTAGYLSNMPELRFVDVGFARITDSGLSFLMRLRNLESLVLGGNRLTSTGLQALRAFRNLRALDLGGKQRTDSGLWSVQVDDELIDAVSSLESLRDLRLASLPVTNAHVQRLAKHTTAIMRIDLSGCAQITDAALDTLAEVKSLTWLNVSGTKVSAEALQKFKQSRTDVKLVAHMTGS
jgi:Leucine-rich repeat (LRR) protein